MYLLLFFLPNIAFASFESFMKKFYENIFNPVFSLLFVIALAYFFYGVFVFISNMDSEDKKTSGKNHMLWGIIGLTIMFSVWGLIRLLVDTFNIKGVEF